MPAKKKETSSFSERKVAQPRKSATFTAEQLEQMTTHELAEMLSNVVMLLRRMPDVPCQGLVARETSVEVAPEIISPVPAVSTSSISIKPLVSEQESSVPNGQDASQSLQQRIDELMDKKYTVAKLKAMADELGIPYPTKATKAELAKRIAERQARGHSEQYAIMNL
jgi:hypothetical protein